MLLKLNSDWDRESGLPSYAELVQGVSDPSFPSLSKHPHKEYDSWVTMTRDLLKYGRLWDIIGPNDAAYSAPDSQLRPTEPSLAEKRNRLAAEHKRKNSIALLVIQCKCGDYPSRMIEGKHSAKEAWAILKDRFKEKGYPWRKYHIFQELVNTKYAGHDADTYYQKLLVLNRRLEKFDAGVPDWQLASLMLMNLPASWIEARNSYVTTHSNDEDLDTNDVYQFISRQAQLKKESKSSRRKGRRRS